MSPETKPATVAFSGQQTAIIADSAGSLIISHHVNLPELQPDALLIKVVAVAVNPSDAKLTGPMAAPGAQAGSDCAGVVVAVGAAIDQDRFRVGDRICAPTLPMDPLFPRDGAFAQFVAVLTHLALRVPEHMSFEQAAAVGTSVATAGHALFRSLRIPGHPERPAAKAATVLVWGGSSATGTMAIQLIQRSGCVALAACSPRNFELAKKCGAVEVFDYNDADCAAHIRSYTGNALSFALDCVCSEESMQGCYAAIGRAGGSYTTLEPFSQRLHTRKRVRPEFILAVSLFGRDISWKEPYGRAKDLELGDFGRDWFRCVQGMLDRGEIHPHPLRTQHKRQGFEGILDGVDLLKQRAVSGEKLVYRIQ
ncbi:GroES-like protein [Xylariaceae sp. FL0594]|nr:GroES-like protein [Xylariaceae sp. FL0594]